MCWVLVPAYPERLCVTQPLAPTALIKTPSQGSLQPFLMPALHQELFLGGSTPAALPAVLVGMTFGAAK